MSENPTYQPMILNQISPTNFQLDIPDNDYTKDLKLAVQGVIIPSINMLPTDVPLNPTLRGKIPGSAIEFDPLVVRILVDEELRAYIGVYKWMLGTIDYVDSNSIRWLEDDQSMAVHIMDNSQTRTIATMRFYGAFPSNLGELELMYTADGDEVVTCMVTFNFKYMEIESGVKVVRPEPRKKANS